MPSEPASETSPATGPETDESKAEAPRADKADKGKKKGRKAGSREYSFGEAPPPFEIVFDPQRTRHLSWAVFHLAFGGLLVAALGTVGQWIGFLLLAFGALRAYKFARTLLAPAGRVTLTRVDADLPPALCASERDHWKIKEIVNVFYLRRSLSWIRTSPVLIIETVGGAYRYPRDWFASDADQRRLANHLNQALSRALPSDLAAPLDRRPPVEITANDRRRWAIGLFIAGGAVVMTGNLGLLDGVLAGAGLPIVSIYVLCGLLVAAGAYFLAVTPPEPDGKQRDSSE